MLVSDDIGASRVDVATRLPLEYCPKLMVSGAGAMFMTMFMYTTK